MAEAIIAPYIESKSEIGTLKSETFTLENFVFSSSVTGTTSNYINNSYGSSGGATAYPAFCAEEYSAGLPVTHTRPTEFVQNITSILCSSLCDVQRCVMTIYATYTSHKNLKCENTSTTVKFGIGWIDTTVQSGMEPYPSIILSASNHGYWTYGWPGQFINNASQMSDTVYAQYDMVSSTSYVGISQSRWRSYDPTKITMGLIQTHSSSASYKWNNAASPNIKITANASCTIIYEDYR